jgi:NAD(P)-dependent dehydrogenase (short-subunit alcohol dehydrogenase family)
MKRHAANKSALWEYCGVEPRFESKVAVVTGGSTGIGLATAQLLIAEGALVYITGRRQAELDAAVASLGPMAFGVQGDIALRADRATLIARLEADRRRVDFLFANAGVGEFGLIGEISEAHFDHIVGVNLKGTFFTIQDLLPLLRDHATIVVTGSTSTCTGIAELAIYSASKAALRSLVRTAAPVLGKRQIRINLLSPGTTDTPLVAPMPSGMLEGIASAAPLGRIADPFEIGRVALFLGSSDSSYITGVELFADGGAAQT